MINEASGEIVYTIRASDGFRPPVYEAGTYTIKTGNDRPDGKTITGVKGGPNDDARTSKLCLNRGVEFACTVRRIARSRDETSGRKMEVGKYADSPKSSRLW